MAYRIEYGSPPRRKRWKLVLLAVGVIAALLIPRQTLERWLVPGDAAVTKAAFQELLLELRQGSPAGEAVATFCKTVVQGAELG